jgi:hypothetical protein
MYFTGGMAGHRKGKFFRFDPIPVIPDRQKSLPSILKYDQYFIRARVNTVLQKFFQHAGWTLNHLSRGDLIAQFRRQELDIARHIHISHEHYPGRSKVLL